MFNVQRSTFNVPRFPLVPGHVDMAIGLEHHALMLQQRALPTPPRSRAARYRHHTVAGQLLRSGRIAQGATHHARMTGPTGPCGDDAVCSHMATRYLRHNLKHCLAEGTGLCLAHMGGIICHVCKKTLNDNNNRRDKIHDGRCRPIASTASQTPR